MYSTLTRHIIFSGLMAANLSYLKLRWEFSIDGQIAQVTSMYFTMVKLWFKNIVSIHTLLVMFNIQYLIHISYIIWYFLYTTNRMQKNSELKIFIQINKQTRNLEKKLMFQTNKDNFYKIIYYTFMNYLQIFQN